MDDIEDFWDAIRAGDVGEVERLAGQDRGLLDARRWSNLQTPLMEASIWNQVGVVRWLMDRGADINEQANGGCTALWFACHNDYAPVVRLLMEGGGDPTITDPGGVTPLMIASQEGHIEVVRLLLGCPSAKATIDRRDRNGETALWRACFCGHGGVVTALLESGADPTIASNNGTTPMAIAKEVPEAGDAGGDDDNRDPDDAGLLSPPRAAGSAWRR
jgi:uncharacterized protein